VDKDVCVWTCIKWQGRKWLDCFLAPQGSDVALRFHPLLSYCVADRGVRLNPFQRDGEE
jgi:hypothetical protein